MYSDLFWGWWAFSNRPATPGCRPVATSTVRVLDRRHPDPPRSPVRRRLVVMQANLDEQLVLAFNAPGSFHTGGLNRPSSATAAPGSCHRQRREPRCSTSRPLGGTVQKSVIQVMATRAGGEAGDRELVTVRRHRTIPNRLIPTGANDVPGRRPALDSPCWPRSRLCGCGGPSDRRWTCHAARSPWTAGQLRVQGRRVSSCPTAPRSRSKQMTIASTSPTRVPVGLVLVPARRRRPVPRSRPVEAINYREGDQADPRPETGEEG